MYFVAWYPTLTRGYRMHSNYFKLVQEKRERDGAGAIIKRALGIEQIQNPMRPL